MTPDRAARLARLIVQHSLAVRAGDLVLISGPPASDPLITALFLQLLQAAALSVIRLRSGVCLDTTFDPSGADADAYLNPLGLPPGQRIDATIGIQTCDPPRHTGRDTPEEADQVGGFLSRAAVGQVRWVNVLDATGSGELAAVVAAAARLDEPDPAAAWQAVRAAQQHLCDRLDGARTIRLVSPRGTDLTLGVGGRRWINCAGEHNLPDGEVFTAPADGQADGVFVGDAPADFNGHTLTGVRLEFRAGRVVGATARTGGDVLEQLLSRDFGAGIVGEVAIGMNDRLTRLTGINLLDEKILGTAHVALGSAYPQTGGTNRSAIHLDLVADLRDGRIEVDGVPVQVAGRFVGP